MKYTALYNMPGYLPEMEPQTFDTLEEACDFLMDEMDRMANDCDDYHIASKWANLNMELAILKHNPHRFSDCVAFRAPDGYCYCIDADYEEMKEELI